MCWILEWQGQPLKWINSTVASAVNQHAASPSMTFLYCPLSNPDSSLGSKSDCIRLQVRLIMTPGMDFVLTFSVDPLKSNYRERREPSEPPSSYLISAFDILMLFIHIIIWNNQNISNKLKPSLNPLHSDWNVLSFAFLEWKEFVLLTIHPLWPPLGKHKLTSRGTYGPSSYWFICTSPLAKEKAFVSSYLLHICWGSISSRMQRAVGEKLCHLLDSTCICFHKTLTLGNGDLPVRLMVKNNSWWWIHPALHPFFYYKDREVF